MFAFVVRQCSHGLYDAAAAAEILLIWSLKNAHRLKYGSRFYHRFLKKNLVFERNILCGENRFQFDYIKYCTAFNVKSAISVDSGLNKNTYAGVTPVEEQIVHESGCSKLNILNVLVAENKHYNGKIKELSNDIQQFLKENQITVQGNSLATPFLSIEDAKFPDDILSVLRKYKITEPTPIQSLSWSYALDGRDFIGISKTGSGKTLGFIIPALLHVKKLKEKRELGNELPLALVLAPTRELALQIQKVQRRFEGNSLRSVCLYGGASRERQLYEIRNGVDICIATPGRILDFINCGALNLSECSFVVLDEADRMLDMGFLPDLREIISKVKCKKQVLMWSATWPKEVRNVAEEFLSDYVMVAVGSTELKPNENVRQIVKVCTPEEKNDRLLDVLNDIQTHETNSKILIFAETKFGVDNMEYFLRKNRLRAAAIHSGKSQNRRELILREFRAGRVTVLIATAVAARGLDIDNISHVINYDCPKYFDEYIHKIGRTARHDKKGTAITFVTRADTTTKYLIDVLEESNEEIPKELYSIAQSRMLSFNAIQKKRKSFKPFNRRERWNYDD